MTRCSQRALFHLVALRNSAMLALLIASVVAQLSRSPTFSSWAFIMRSGLKLALAAAILVWTGRVEPALSEPADFYKGKDVKLIISATVGGGYDVYARALAKHLGEHIPGNPTIIPQNLPAAGGIAAANHMYNVAPRDGTVICLLQNTVAFEPFYANRQAQFDAGLRRTDARDDDWRRGRGLDARVLWPRLQSALQYEGTPDHWLSRTERNPASVGERRGRSHGLSILVEHQDDASGLVSPVQDTSLVSVRLGAPSGARGRAVRARSLAQRRRQGAADRRLRAARPRSSFHGSAGYSR